MKNNINSLYEDLPPYVRKAQMRMLDILIIFDRICKKHDIPYWIISGTLLGAKRHQGFIPWDDDIDVQVLQKDYTRLLHVLELELPERFIVHSKKNDDNYRYYFAKIRDTYSFYDEPGCEKMKYHGVFVDIFPVESTPSNTFKYLIDIILSKHRDYKNLNKKWKQMVGYSLGILLPICLTYIALIRFTYRFIPQKNLTYSYGIPFHYYNKIETIFPLSEIEFESQTFKAPHNIEQHLRDNFGSDFMQIPPKQKRIHHSNYIYLYELLPFVITNYIDLY